MNTFFFCFFVFVFFDYIFIACIWLFHLFQVQFLFLHLIWCKCFIWFTMASSIFIFFSIFQARFCKNVTKGRELWNDIMTEGHGNEASMWLNFYQFERFVLSDILIEHIKKVFFVCCKQWYSSLTNQGGFLIYIKNLIKYLSQNFFLYIVWHTDIV